MVKRFTIKPWIIALFGGVLLALAHRGEILLGLPALLCALWLLKADEPAWRLGLVFGCGESLCIVDVWFLQPAAGFFALAEFAGYRGLTFGVLGALFQRRFCSPWLLGVLWALFEAVHARLPLSVPNVLGELFVETPLSSLIVWFGSFGTSAWLVGGIAAVMFRCRDLLSIAVLLSPLTLTAMVAFEGEDYEEQPLEPKRITLIRGGVKLEDYSTKDIVQHYIKLSSSATPVDLVIWPETATGKVWNRDEDFMRLVTQFGSSQPLLFGGTRLSDTGRILNGAFFLDRSGAQVMDKYRQVWPIEEAYADGSLSRDVNTKLGRIRVLICADTLDPWSVITTASNPFEILVVLADASRFIGSKLADMHLRRTQVRAMEAGTWALFVEQSETLAVVNPRGTIAQLDTNLYQPGELRVELGRLGSARGLLYWLCVWGAMIGLALVDETLRRRQTIMINTPEQPSESPS